MDTPANIEWLSTFPLQRTPEEESIMRRVASYICVNCYIILGKKLEFNRCDHCQSTFLQYQDGRATSKLKRVCQIWQMNHKNAELCITHKDNVDRSDVHESWAHESHISEYICPRCSVEVPLIKWELPHWAGTFGVKRKPVFTTVPRTLCRTCYRVNRLHHITCSVCHKDKPLLGTQEEGGCNEFQCNRCNKPICNDCIEESTFLCELHYGSEVYHTLCSTCTKERHEPCQRILPSLMKEPRTCKGSICTLPRQDVSHSFVVEALRKRSTCSTCSTCNAKLCLGCSNESVTNYQGKECLYCAYQKGGACEQKHDSHEPRGSRTKRVSCSHPLMQNHPCKACGVQKECVYQYTFSCLDLYCNINKQVYLCCRHQSTYQVGGRQCHLCRRRKCKSCVKDDRDDGPEYISTCRTCGELTCQPCCVLDGSASGIECLLCGQQRAAVEVIIPWWRDMMYAPGSSYVKRVLERRFEEMQKDTS